MILLSSVPTSATKFVWNC